MMRMITVDPVITDRVHVYFCEGCGETLNDPLRKVVSISTPFTIRNQNTDEPMDNNGHWFCLCSECKFQLREALK